MVHSSCRSISHSSEPQSSTVRVSSARHKCLGHRRSKHKLVEPHCLCLPSHSSPSQGDPKSQAMQLPDHCNSPRLARDALVLGPSATLNRGPTSATSVNNNFKQSHNYTFHSNPQHLNLHAWCLGVDSSKNKAVIVDTLGPAGLHISQSSDLNRLLSSFHRDCPKSSRNLPKWNHSVVLNELTKTPFKPMKDTDLKHLTVSQNCLLALACGKCHSEIHAWVANKVSNLGQWEKVALFPSSERTPTSKRRFSKCVSGDYSCFDYHCR